MSNIFGLTFSLIFIAEAAIKLAALRRYYFKKSWNQFEFLIVVCTILSLALPDQSGSAAYSSSYAKFSVFQFIIQIFFYIFSLTLFYRR